MIEATPIARVSRAHRTRAAESGEGRLSVGNQVDLHSLPSTKTHRAGRALGLPCLSSGLGAR
eukprot:4390585-Pyramimonas_sp.AAC.1